MCRDMMTWKGAAPNQYDYDVFDATAEYTFKVGESGKHCPRYQLSERSLW